MNEENFQKIIGKKQRERVEKSLNNTENRNELRDQEQTSYIGMLSAKKKINFEA